MPYVVVYAHTHPWNIEKVFQNVAEPRPLCRLSPRASGRSRLPTTVRWEEDPSKGAATCPWPSRCTHRRRGTHFNAGLVIDGATSNFVGVQNSFETAEAGGTGVWEDLDSLVKGTTAL